MLGASTFVAISLLALSPADNAVEPAANLKPVPDIAAQYESLKSSTPRDADSQVKLALWCEAHGLEQEKLKHLAGVVLRDPSNALARGLLGLVEFQGKWKRPEAVTDTMKVDVAHADLLAEYDGRRVKTKLKAVDQFKLAVWCEENGLKDQARAHLATVVRLDPNHGDAWKKLGYKKVGNRWITEAQATGEKHEKVTQTAADKSWRPRLEKLREALASKGSKESTEKALAEISDPRAVPMVMAVFVAKSDKDHVRAVQILGQIDSIEASRGLALIALYSSKDEARSRATETLRRRDPREYADLLISRLQDKVKFEVKHVGGPGSPGSLFIEGKEQNLKRFYAPPVAPNVAVFQGDTLTRDADGNLVLVHHSESFSSGIFAETGFTNISGSAPQQLSQLVNNGIQTGGSVGGYRLNVPAPMGKHIWAQTTVTDSLLPVSQGPRISQFQFDQMMQQFAARDPMLTGLIGNSTSSMAQFNVVQDGYRVQRDGQVYVPVGRMQAEAQRVAMSAEKQLQSDVAVLEAHNKKADENNEFVGAILTSATRVKLALEPKLWKKWFVNQVGYRYDLSTPDEVPTVVENVPLIDQAQVIPNGIGVVSTMMPDTRTVTVTLTRHSCFGKGTPVQTLNGPRPIESLNIGDQVLTQDMKTGKLGYQAVLVVHRNPPSETYKITIDGKPIVSSYFHRFWKAGQGWVMARDLKVGDRVRTLGGVSQVSAIEADKVQPVFNLDVANDADFFAGEIAALVHDNTLPDLKQRPFDAPASLAVAEKK